MAIDFVLFCSNSYYLLLNSSSWTNSQLYLLHSVAGVIPMVGGRSPILPAHYAGQFTFNSIRRVHLGSRSSSLEALHPPFVVVQTVGNLESTRRQSFVVLHAVARRNWSMRHFWSITGRYIHLQRNWLYSCVATVDCGCFSDFLFLSLPYLSDRGPDRRVGIGRRNEGE